MKYTPVAIGNIYGRLTVTALDVKRARSNGEPYHECVCSCGNKIETRDHSLKAGKRQSCGCLRLDAVKERGPRITKGMKQSSEYLAWCNIKKRCYDKSDANYKNYGAKGIAVCDEWRRSFPLFIAHMGRKPSPDMSIDRIDPYGPYSPENCRWATREEQANNKRKNRFIELNGARMTIAQWSRATGIPQSTIKNRLNRGLSAEDALAADWLEGRERDEG